RCDALRVPPHRRLDDLRHEAFRTNQLAELRVVRRAVRTGRVEDGVGETATRQRAELVVHAAQPYELRIRRDPIEDDVSVLAEEGDIVGCGVGLEIDSWRTAKGSRHRIAPPLTACEPRTA